MQLLRRLYNPPPELPQKGLWTFLRLSLLGTVDGKEGVKLQCYLMEGQRRIGLKDVTRMSKMACSTSHRSSSSSLRPNVRLGMATLGILQREVESELQGEELVIYMLEDEVDMA